MTKQEIEENNIIERYLLNQLSESELSAFNLVLMRDKSLQAELKKQRLLFKTLWKSKQQLPIVQKRSKWHLAFGLLAFLGLIGAIVYWQVNPAQQTPIDQLTPTTTDTTTAPLSAPIMPNEKEDKRTDPVEEQQRPTTTQQEDKLEKESLSYPIAANFDALPEWERYITETATLSRGSDYELTLEQPKQKSELFLTKGQLMLACKGTIKQLGQYIPRAFKFRLFNNTITDFRNNNAMEEIALPLHQEGDLFHFSTEQNISLKPGLYYFRIDDMETGEKYFVGKLRVNAAKE